MLKWFKMFKENYSTLDSLQIFSSTKWWHGSVQQKPVKKTVVNLRGVAPVASNSTKSTFTWRAAEGGVGCWTGFLAWEKSGKGILGVIWSGDGETKPDVFINVHHYFHRLRGLLVLWWTFTNIHSGLAKQMKHVNWFAFGSGCLLHPPKMRPQNDSEKKTGVFSFVRSSLRLHGILQFIR